ncbi:hypothetical protein DV738_g1514, partial [Chaetothyriales sp. CBS 135597]
MISKPNSHFNDWPNSQGFDTSYVEESPVELAVDGTIPPWVSGTLFRPAPGPREVSSKTGNTYRVSHWFDFLCQIHRFQIVQSDHGAKVIYNSRLAADGLIQRISERGNLDGITFARKYDPCKSFFAKLQSFFFPGPSAPPKPNEVNVTVTMSKNFPGLARDGSSAETSYDAAKLETLYLKTDAPFMQSIDPETLEPVGVAYQASLHPDLKGHSSASHAEVDPLTGDVFNFNLEFGRAGTYRVFRVSTATGQTSILAKFSHHPAYLHSLFLSENYVILCVWNSFFRAGGLPVLWNRNIVDAISYDPSHPATWFVIDKNPEGRGVVASYESDPFFCFHSINAYEEPSADGTTVDIFADLAGFSNMHVIDRFYYENLMSDSPNAVKWSSDESIRPTYRQYKLASVPHTSLSSSTAAAPDQPCCPRRAELLFTSPTDHCPELPVINPAMSTHKHRYIYGINDSGKSTLADSLIKYDTHSHTIIRWSQHGHTAGEPVFIANPDATEEDDGVLLSVVLDGIEGRSYLAVLSSRTMQLIATAAVNGIVGLGFHGLYNKS